MMHLLLFSATTCVSTDREPSNLIVWTQNMWSFEPEKNSSERREIEFAHSVRSLPLEDQPDIIFFQEMWFWGRRKWTRIKQILDEAGYNYYPAKYSLGIDNIYGLGIDGASGLAFAAKKEIKLESMIHKKFTGGDGKGVVYAKFKKSGMPMHAFNAHLSWKFSDHVQRKKEINDISKHYEAQKIPEEELVLFGGDFNMDYHKHKNNKNEKTRKDVEDADEPNTIETVLKTKIPKISPDAYTWDTRNDFVPAEGEAEDYNTYFDYLLFPEMHAQFLESASYRIFRIRPSETFAFSQTENSEKFVNEKGERRVLCNANDISDHFGLEVRVTLAKEPIADSLEKKMKFPTATVVDIQAPSKPSEQEIETKSKGWCSIL